MSIKRVVCALVFAIIPLYASQPAVDSLLFRITLNDDTASIYGCQWNDRLRSTLAGPVLMAGKHLLFYSQNGYVLYNESGKLLDSHSLMRDNAQAAARGEEPLLLAYPLDSLTLIYYRKAKVQGAADDIYLKEILKKGLKKVSITASSYEIYSDISRGQLFNLASNSITDEMGQRNFLLPQLVGYTTLQGGTRWWSIDRLYAFSSPLIVEDQGVCNSFFPGLKSDQKCEVQAHRIEPLGVFQVQGRWYYMGVATSLGNKDDEYYQILVLCDQAGNMLYSSKLLKQEIGDALLQYVEKTNTNYTVRRAVRHVFVPAIDRKGDICYGILDFGKKQIEVYKRMFLRYQPQEASGMDQKLFAKANEIAYSPLLLDCNEESSGEGLLPEVTRMGDDGFQTLDKKALARKGYYVTVHRVIDQNLKKKLSRTQERLPRNVQKAQDSIAGLISAWCPYSIALNHEERGRLNFLHYGLHDELLCARVIAVTDSGEVFVRVDCEKWAEVVEFDADGCFVSRFVFNEQSYEDRKDLVVVGKNRSVAEEDYESPKGRRKHYVWRLMSADRRHAKN